MKTDHRSRFPFALLLAATLLAGCAGDEAANAPDAAGADSPAAAESVEYEPAFPEEVSSEGLTESDSAQQETHTHADGETHSHAEGEEHEHDGSEGEHAHDGGEDHEH